MLRLRLLTLTILCVSLLALVHPPSLRADAIFTAISLTNNDAGNVAIGMRQLRLTLSEVDANHVAFTFTNTPPPGYTFQPSSITDVYFDDGALLSGILAPVNGADPWNPVITSSSGVDFSWWAKPVAPPDSTALDVAYAVVFSADSSPPRQPNGINHWTEWLTITWRLKDGLGYDDAVRAVENLELRVAVKVQGYANGGSETFIFVPLPQAAAGGLLLLGVFGASRGRRLRWRAARGRSVGCLAVPVARRIGFLNYRTQVLAA